MRVLIIEDEEALRNQLVSELQRNGCVVDEASTGEEGFYFAEEYFIDLAIVDLGLPRMSGIQLIEKLRKNGHIFPILILTARDRWDEKVEGLEAGADDYMSKPFHFEELLARARALIRRAGGHAKNSLEVGNIKLNIQTKRVTVDNQNVELTAYEYKILKCLMLNAGRVVSKYQLTEQLYSQDFDRDSNVIEVLMRRLRTKLDPDNISKPIETLRGQGYRLIL